MKSYREPHQTLVALNIGTVSYTHLDVYKRQEQFSGYKGKYVPLSETVRSFKELLAGKYDDLPEQAFMFVGTIEEAAEKARQLGQ